MFKNLFLVTIRSILLLLSPRARENRKIAQTVKSKGFEKWIKFKTRDRKSRKLLDTRVHNSVKEEFGKDAVVTDRFKVRALKKMYLFDKRNGLIKFKY